jgi:hypothetical protein
MKTSLLTHMKLPRTVAHQPVQGGDRILVASGLVVLVCAVYLPTAITHGLGVTKPIAAAVSLFAGPVCFLLGIREITRYERRWWTISSVAASGLATVIAWLVALLVAWGRFP